MKCPFRSYFNWLVLFIYLVQYSFIYISCLKPSDILHTSEFSTVFGYIESSILYPPWVFSSNTLMIDSIFFFSICMAPFFIIAYSQIHIKKFNNQKHVNFWCALVIRICQQFLTPLMATPIVFRFSFFIEQVFILKHRSDYKMIFSFVICTMNIILQIIHTYFAALFFFPIDFIAHSKADFYDGKYMTLVFFIRTLIGVACFELSYLTNKVVAGIVISAIFLCCFLTLYFRLTIQVHVSAMGQYLEVLPFFACPFMCLFNYFIHNEVYSLFLLIFLYIVFGILFKIHNYFIIKQCLKAFAPFMEQNKRNEAFYSNTRNLNDNLYFKKNDDIWPKFFMGSVTTVIRIVATQYSDPDCLLRFLEFQKKSSIVKNSCIIEVIRFLALFPSRRKECLKELKHFKSRSNFNLFTVFIFRKILKSLNNIESTKKNLVCLNNFYRSYLVHKHLYWVSRKEKKVFIAAREALSAAYFFIEVKNEFHYLLKRYTYDSFLHYYYADFCLSACGDFEGYLKECQIARMLDNLSFTNNSSISLTNISISSASTLNSSNRNMKDKINSNSIVDPLLHPMSIINPKILQYCSLEEKEINLNSVKKNVLDIHQSSLQSNKNECKKTRPVATFLSQKKHLVPLLSIFHIYVPIALFLYVISELFSKDQQIHRQSEEIYNTSVQLVGIFYVASSTMYLPYLSYEFSLNLLKNETSFFSTENYRQKIRLKENTFMNELKDKNLSINNYFLNLINSNLILKNNENIFLNDSDIMKTFIAFPFDIISFYSMIPQLGNLTGGVIYTLEQFIIKRIFKNYTLEEVLEKLPVELDYSIRVVFNEVYKKLIEIKKKAIILREIYKNDLNSYFICKVAIITIVVFAGLSSIVYIIQINIIDMTDKIKIDFLSSEKLFALFLFQESKKAWELLRQYKESSSDLTTVDTNLNSSRSLIKLSHVNLSTELGMFDINEDKPNQIDTNNIQEPLLEMAVNGHNFNKDLRSLVNSNSYIKDSHKLSFNFKYKKQKNIDLAEIDDNDGNSKFNTDDLEDSSNNSVIEDTDSNSDSTFHQDSDICDQAILISEATEKEAFVSGPYFHLVILLCAPLIFAVVVIALFQFPLSQVAFSNEETFQNILNGESMANHSLIILNATFDILDRKIGIMRKNAKFIKDKSYNEIIHLKENIDHLIHNFFNHEIIRLSNIKKENVNQKNHKKRLLNEKHQHYKPLEDYKQINKIKKRKFNNNKINNEYQIDNVEEFLKDLKNLSDFQEEKCYDFSGVVCMSVDTALKVIMSSDTPTSTIATKCAPLIYLFTWNLFQDLFFSSVKDLFLMKISNGKCFVVSTVLLMLTVVHVSLSSSLLLRKAFNSLFHYPSDFINPPIDKSKDKLNNNNGKLPKNALVITSITESDEIYSVSDNSKEIINRNLNDLISLKLSETFPKVMRRCFDGDFMQLCEFAITDKNKKMFRYSTEQIGCLTKTIMIEENSPAIEKVGEKSYVQRLNGFIPPYFAELYVKNDQVQFNYCNNFIISVRISDEISPQLIEKCFNEANHLSQCSVSLHIIRVEGEMITFSSASNCKLVTILLLIRDFINIVDKNTKIKNSIYSIYVHFMDYFWITVVDDDDEPYLELQPYNQDFFRFRLYQIENGKIAFSENFESKFQSILKITEKNAIPVDFEGNEEVIHTLSMNALSSKIMGFV